MSQENTTPTDPIGLASSPVTDQDDWINANSKYLSERTDTPIESTNPTETANDEGPLDFSMKKRESVSGDGVERGASPVPSPLRPRSITASQSHTPTAIPAPAAPAVLNVGCNSQQQRNVMGAAAHYLTEQLLRGHSDHSGNTPSTPPTLSLVHSPHNGHHQPTSSNAAIANRNAQQKIQRPFKAYNPMDPMSALQVGASLAPSALPLLNAALTTSISSPTPSSPTVLPAYLNAQLLSQYRQYLINAQAAAALASLRAKSSQHCQQLHTPPGRQQSHEPSPPEVTSTSHPHTADALATIRQNTTDCNDNTAGTKTGLGPDRRISSGSGSGSAGSSFNGGEEEDEELMQEDDEASSNRTSPTPSCASSTNPRRFSLASVGDNHNSNGNGTNKGENGANGITTRRKGRSLPDALKDDAYWERRRKNNEAAKRSRDARRAKEDEIAIRAALLEQENMRLRIELAALKTETEKLRQMLLNT